MDGYLELERNEVLDFNDKILDLAVISRNLTNYKIKQFEFPVEKFREDGTLEKTSQYIIKWNEKENIKLLHEFIYN